ncbi:MAG: LytTR family transcriptional regulator DNA-binding domain-containing protein [Treponema sp.]|nr:LytTR family transcriptional regulator DNA-binding domain-containing protein [Treponema sp.]
MKISINTDEQRTETEIIVNCIRLDDDIDKLLAAIRMLDTKLSVSKDKRHFVIDTADVIYIESTDKRTFLYTNTDVYESHLKLYELEEKLAGCNFLRASKNCLFNINHVQSIEPDLHRLILTTAKGIKLIVSRQYAAAVKLKLES